MKQIIILKLYETFLKDSYMISFFQNPHIFRGAILAGYTPYPTRHPHPIDKSYMWGQYAPFGMDGRAVFAPSMR